VHSYRISGLLVESELALPGAMATAVGGPADVTVRYGAVPEALPGASASGPTWQMEGDRFLLCIPNIARFLLAGGRSVVVEPASEATVADIPVFMLGTVLSLLQHQRARIVLHASAVCVNGRAVLFCGRSGAGKSTLAATLAQHGYPVINDDVCAISIEHHERPVVYPDGRKPKLWSRDIERLGLAERRGERVRRHLDKYYVDFGGRFSEPLPIAAVYDLHDALPPIEPGIKRSNAVDATLTLKRFAYRQNMVTRLDQWPLYFKAAITVANSSAMFNLHRVRDFSQLAALVAALERHWIELRLMEATA